MHPIKTAWVLLSFMASLSALATLAPGAHARASEVELPVRLPQAKALGMKTSVHRLGDGTVRIRIDDLVTREATEIVENSRSLTRESRQFDAKGRVLEVVSITPGVIVTEDYLAQPPKKTQRTFDEQLNQKVETFEKEATGWKKTSESKLSARASMTCNAAMSEEELERRLRNLSDPVVDLAGSPNGDVFTMTNNLRARGCHRDGGSQYPGRPPGAYSLMYDLEQAWDQGIRCMNNLWRQHRNDPDPVRAAHANGLRRAARQIMGNFVEGAAKRFTIVCEAEASTGFFETAFGSSHIHDRDFNALALTCRSPGGAARSGDDIPGIALNISAFRSKSVQERRATLFHELLHHIPIFHTEGAANYDAVYGLQFCCFGIDASSALTMQPSERETFTGSRFVCESVLSETHGQPRGR